MKNKCKNLGSFWGLEKLLLKYNLKLRKLIFYKQKQWKNEKMNEKRNNEKMNSSRDLNVSSWLKTQNHMKIKTFSKFSKYQESLKNHHFNKSWQNQEKKAGG